MTALTLAFAASSAEPRAQAGEPGAANRGAPAAAPPTTPRTASQPKRPAYPRVVTLAAMEDDADAAVLVQVVEPGVLAWELLSPSGDDLSATLLVASDRRTGKEAVTEAACRAHAVFLKQRLPDATLKPRPILDVDACATEARAVIRRGTGKVPRPTWITFVERPNGDPPGYYPRMLDYGDQTELWVWGLVPLPAGQKQDRDVPVGWKMDAMYWGVDMPLVLPEPPRSVP